MIRFAPLAALPLGRIVESRSVIVSRRVRSPHLPRRRVVVRRRIGSAHLSVALRLARLFAALVAPPCGLIVISRAVIGSPGAARRRFVARRIVVFLVAFGCAFRSSTVRLSLLSRFPCLS